MRSAGGPRARPVVVHSRFCFYLIIYLFVYLIVYLIIYLIISLARKDGAWGRRIKLFYHEFYGEGFEVKSGQCYTRMADTRPYAGIVWSGRGVLNGVHRKSCIM